MNKKEVKPKTEEEIRKASELGILNGIVDQSTKDLGDEFGKEVADMVKSWLPAIYDSVEKQRKAAEKEIKPKVEK